uniref:Uncharacterized protein n=1 Tax=Chromera velia CCMP2878 TaxID=1169474 RepID=A0A0G4I139_9ALVE|mmetsp:Transcript_47634/g.93994  ORF Transcript_47634/g.93994 Transcript_47634/m.93994 type:complete len:174 (+) Transcript_47634:204-725(+)|eukprot:Cvel_20.t1-p1 / transcript=Cvel_20.t1 / gene=Cvel_20 / organism=Chromera_velia_CCMP2878 / gene_product=hypothetical protein / transcript_product=hypothetical protein / location=Cvel_scaffold5:142571-144445(+) / protein_length=173 / sequence_SO=supercontig / SO=protein_coding / is_pseudo=false
MTRLVVPSDITILEEKNKLGKRRLGFLEGTGLFFMPPIFHIRYSKNDASDMRKVLSNKYPDSGDAVVEIVKTRQNSISKQAKAQNGWWLGTLTGVLFTHFSFRHYDWKTKAILLPFTAYMGAIAGRCAGNGLAGRWWEPERDRFLGALPPKAYFVPPPPPPAPKKETPKKEKK